MAHPTVPRSPAGACLFLTPAALDALAQAVSPHGWYAGRAVAALDVGWLALAAGWLVLAWHRPASKSARMAARTTARKSASTGASSAAEGTSPPASGALRDQPALMADLRCAVQPVDPALAPVVGLVLVGLDHLGGYADRHGPAAAEALQREVGDLLVETVRAGDTAYRCGDGRFAVLLRGGGVPAAAALAERLRQLVARTFVQQGATASFGVAAAPDVASTAHALVEAAESALSDANRLGRNRVAVAAALEPELRQVRANAARA